MKEWRQVGDGDGWIDAFSLYDILSEYKSMPSSFTFN